MPTWINGKTLLTRWNIIDFELFEYVKKGLQPYSQSGQPIPSPDVRYKKYKLEILQREYERLKNRQNNLNNALNLLKKKGRKGVPHQLAGEINLWIDETSRGKKSIFEQVEEKKKEISSLKRRQPSLKKTSWERYSLSETEADRKKILNELVDALYEIEAIQKLEGEYDELKMTSQEESEKQPLDNYEDLIRGLRISYESDSEIKIQEPGKSPINYHYKILSFSTANKTWKAFLDILKDPNPIYNVGPAHNHFNGKKIRIHSYDRKMKRLREINKKLITFLNKNYPIQIPDNFKLYESADKRGTYKFKFQILYSKDFDETLDVKYRRLKKDDLVSKFEEHLVKYRRKEGSVDLERVNIAAKILIEKGWKTEDEITASIYPNGDKEDIRYDPFENIEDKKPTY